MKLYVVVYPTECRKEVKLYVVIYPTEYRTGEYWKEVKSEDEMLCYSFYDNLQKYVHFNRHKMVDLYNSL